MPLSQADRIAFSLAEVTADTQIAGIKKAKEQVQVQLDKLQALDTANSHLFSSPNDLINLYQLEFQNLDGTIRTTFVEQNILDSANKTLQNYFFPNDIDRKST